MDTQPARESQPALNDLASCVCVQTPPPPLMLFVTTQFSRTPPLLRKKTIEQEV